MQVSQRMSCPMLAVAFYLSHLHCPLHRRPHTISAGRCFFYPPAAAARARTASSRTCRWWYSGRTVFHGFDMTASVSPVAHCDASYYTRGSNGYKKRDQKRHLLLLWLSPCDQLDYTHMRNSGCVCVHHSSSLFPHLFFCHAMIITAQRGPSISRRLFSRSDLARVHAHGRWWECSPPADVIIEISRRCFMIP